MKSMMGLVFGLLLSTSAMAQDHAAPLVLQAFQNSCSSAGKWSEAVLQQNRLMVGVLQTLKDQDPCKAFSGKLATIESTSRQIEALLADQTYIDYRQAEEKLQSMMLALQSNLDPAVVTAMGEQIVATQVSLAEKRAIYQTTRDIQGRDRYEKATLELNRYIQGLLTDSGGMTACLKSSPAAAVQLSSNLLAMGGSFISPIYGAAASVIGQIVNLGVEYFRTNQKEKEIYRLYASQVPTALTCGLESMTSLYCQADDAFSLLQLQSRKPDPTKPLHPVWADLDVIKRQLPNLDLWLQKVRNGVTPSNPTEAQRQNEIWQKVQGLENLNRTLLGFLNYRSQLYENESSPEDKINFLVSTVYAMSNYTSENTSFNEYTSSPYTKVCYLSQGLGACPSQNVGEGVEEYIKRNFSASLKDMSVLIANWGQFFGVVERRVANEFNQSISMDPSSILTAAYEVNKEKISPVTATKSMIAFLVRLEETTSDDLPQRKQLVVETTDLLEKFLELIADPDIRDSKDKIREVFKIFQLGQNTKFLRDRISDFVMWDLTDHLHAGNFPEDAQDILISGAVDIKTRLEASAVARDLVEADLNTARMLATGNIETFNSFFHSSAGSSLEALWNKWKAAGEPATGVNRPFGQSLARLCIMQLTTRNQWPKELDWKYCQEAVLYSIYTRNGQPLTIRLSDLKNQVAQMPVSKRLCVYHSFVREGRVAEMLNQKSIFSKRRFH